MLISQQFASIADFAAEPMLLLGLDGRILGCNRAASRLLLSPTSALLERSLVDFLETPVERFQGYLRTCARTSEYLPGRVDLRLGDERATTLRCDGAKLRTPKSGPTSVIMRLRSRSAAVSEFTKLNERIDELNREISERRLAERRMLLINECFLDFTDNAARNIERLVETCGHLIAVSWVSYVRLDGERALPVASWNAPLALCQDDPLPLEGRLLERATRAPDSIEVLGDLSGTPYAATDPAVREFGAVTYIGRAIMVRGSCLGVLGAYATEPLTLRASERRALDILGAAIAVEEDRRLAEELLREYNDELVRARDDLQRQTVELSIKSRDLELARAAAEAASNAKNAFMANISHEIRTPMNAVVGLVEILLDTDLDAEQRDCVLTIQDGATSLMGVLNDVLDFAKLEAGRLSFELLDFDLGDRLAAIERIFIREAQSKGLAFTVAIADDVPLRLKSDPLRLRQVLINLINNAIKFTEHGAIQLSVSRESESTTHVVLRFEVCDTGIGIPEHVRPQLFNAFTQADESTTRRFGGTGLGLTICKRMVELMGGDIGVESTPERGSTFWFTACFAKQEASADETVTHADIAGRSIMVVDDNETNRRILVHHLTSFGIRPALASDGREALVLLREHTASGAPCDAAILDIHMPGMDGIELARAIREDQALDGTRLLLLTSVGHRLDRENLRALAIDDHLIKPIRRVELYQALHRLWSQSPTTPPDEADEHDAIEPDTRILLVEDNPVNMKVALRLLERLGYREIDTASNGLQALERFERKLFDVILMDCQMPELDGYAASRLIREREADRDQHVRIIAMTAHAMDGAQTRCLDAGMDDYVAKPVSAKRLGQALARQLMLARSAP